MLRVTELTKAHDRKGFNCGNTALNHFLKNTARQAASKHLSRTFVLTDGESLKILGFFSLTVCEVNILDVPEDQRKKYPPQKGLPAVRLARLGVSLHEQGKGYGEILLAEAISRTARVAEAAGAIGLYVDAKDGKAKSFYEKYGFAATGYENPFQLFMPTATLIAAA